jgi:hypothetical protein
MSRDPDAMSEHKIHEQRRSGARTSQTWVARQQQQSPMVRWELARQRTEWMAETYQVRDDIIHSDGT